MIEAGVLSLRIAPVTTGFWRETDAKLRSQKAPKAEVNVAANIREASREMAMFRMREQANAVNLKVKVDERSLRTANEKIKYIEHTWKQSDIKRAVRVQVFVAGAAALPALTQGIVSVTAAMTELGRVALGLPGLLAGVGAAAATLLTGIRGVGEALKAAGSGMESSAQYARQYAQASRALESAQRDVVRALRDANREIEDQKTKLAEGALSVEQAQINVRRAREALARGGFQSFTDYQQALLDVRKANLDLSNTIRQNNRDIQDYYENAGRGATQSDGFRDSIERLSSAVDNYRKAQFQAAGMSEQFISAMKNLSPAGQDFVLQMLKMRGAWRSFKDSIETTFFKGLGDSITNLANRQLPILKTGMQRVAASLNSNFKSLFESLGRQSNLDAVSKIFERTGRALRAANPGIDSFTNGLLKLSEAGSRFLPRLALAFNKVMDNFESFINKADRDGSLERWIDSGLKLVSSLGRSILHIGSILNSVTEAYNRATGNVGGFASTVERWLSGVAKSLASPGGQGRLIAWMRTSREFMQTISESLPGIRKIFAAIGDGARNFAETAFPIFAKLGDILSGRSGVVTALIQMYLAFRTLKPILSSSTKLLHQFNAQVDKFNQKRAQRISDRTSAWKQMFDAQGMQYAAGQRLKDMRLDLQRSVLEKKQAEIERRAARKELADARAATKQARKEAKAAGSSVATGLIIPESVATNNKKIIKERTRAFREAKDAEAKALERFNRAEQAYSDASVRRAQMQFDAQNKMPMAYRDFRNATNLATEAQKNFQRVSNLTADGWTGRWARTADFFTQKVGALRSAFVVARNAILGIAGSVGLTVALDQMIQAQDRAKASADNLRESQEALAQTLSKTTGSATAATIEENARQLQDRADPYQPDDQRARFNAATTLERQLGIPLSEAVTLALPTEVKKREARLATSDERIIAAVPELQEWKQWGEKYKQNGVDERVYGKALNGDPESIGRVEAARKAIKDSSAFGRMVNMGVAANTGYAPDDLGAAQQQLPTTGPTMTLSNGDEVPGGLRALSLATGALRATGNNALEQGQREQQNAQMVQQFGLNARGRRAFGPFQIGAAGALMRPDGSGVIEVDRFPDDVIRGWSDGAAANGIRVERRYPSGAIITIDPEFAKQYFKQSAAEFARGGSVWGAGTATSDSIPAMLSNGEFVINAKSASLIGHDNLNKLNSIGKFSNGGPVLKLAPGGSVDDNGGNIFSNAWDWIREHVFYSEPNPDEVAARNGVPPAPLAPPRVSVPVDSSPVSKPLPAGPSGPDLAATLGGPNGALYIPRLDGSGALPDIPSINGRIGTDASIAKGAVINPNANIIDFMVQAANSWGLAVGSGPANQDLADELGTWIHSDDGGQHSVNRALDIGNLEQAKAGLMTNFVKDWMSDPNKVAATRQLIFQDPNTKEVFAIYGGKAYFGQEAWDIYGGDFAGHQDHIHLAMEGVPASMFSPSGAGTPLNNAPKTRGSSAPSAPTGSSDPDAYRQLPDAPVPGPARSTPSAPSGPAAEIPSAPMSTGPAQPPLGPAADIAPPMDPMYFLKQIGAAILKGIFGFFGINASEFVDQLFGLIPDGQQQQGPSASDRAAEIPSPDPVLLDQMDQQIEAANAQGTPEGKELAKRLTDGKNDYIKQFSDASIKASAENLAQYYESIGDGETAAKLRGNSGKIGKVPPPPGKPETPKPANKAPSLIEAPPANYSPNSMKSSRDAVYRAFKEAGFPDEEWPPLVELLNHENDTWDPTRPTGGPNSDASGIFQFLSTTWGTVGMEYSEDPYIQGVAGMKYIKQRYGTPSAAWAFWQNPSPPGPPGWPHWYALGGLVKLAGGGMIGKRSADQWGDGSIDPIDAMYGDPFLAAFGPPAHGADISNLRMVYPEENSAGGYISGPGTGTSDSIPAMLSNGEFVMRAAAVKSIGVDALNAMNQSPAKFATGGLIGDAINPVILPNQDEPEPDWRTGIQVALDEAGFYGNQSPPWNHSGYAYSGSVDPKWTPGPTPNVSNSPFKGGLNSISTGVMNAAGASIDGVIESIKDPIGALKGMAQLVMPLTEENRRNLFGEDVVPLGEAWKGIAKETLQWDMWGENPLEALGGVVTNFGGAIAGGAGMGGRALAANAERNSLIDEMGVELDLRGASRRTQRVVKDTLIDLANFSQSVPLTAIRLRTPEQMVARAGPEYDTAYAFADGWSRDIVLNKDYFGKGRAASKALRESAALSERTGFHHPALGNPTRAILAHEYGHILDFHAGSNMSQIDIYEVLNSQFEDLYPGLTGLEAFEAMSRFLLRDSTLSGYSYGKKYAEFAAAQSIYDLYGGGAPSEILAALDREETIGEAFSDVFMRGMNATRESRAIYERFSQTYNKKIRDSLGTGDRLPNLGTADFDSRFSRDWLDLLGTVPGRYGEFPLDLLAWREVPEKPTAQWSKVVEKIQKHYPELRIDGLSNAEKALVERLFRAAESRGTVRIPASWFNTIQFLYDGIFPNGQNSNFAQYFVSKLFGLLPTADVSNIYSVGRRSVPAMASGPRPLEWGPRISRDGPGMSWDSFAEYANDFWSWPIEDGIQGWQPTLVTGPDGLDENGKQVKLGGKKDQLNWVGIDSTTQAALPLGSPFTYNQLTALSDYSGSSSVNKTLRGMDDLPGLARTLQGIIDIRPQMEGPGGRITQYSPGKIEAAAKAGISDGLSPDQVILSMAREFPGASTQQLWELWFVAHLRASRLRASRLLANLDQAGDMTAAFERAKPTGRDLWVTRMIDDFGFPMGPDFDPESLVGTTIAGNPGFTSTSGGFTNKPKGSPGYRWQHRAGRGAGSNPFQGRPIMEQIFVPQGTPALWFGGHENELLLPFGMKYNVLGQENILDSAGIDDAELQRVLQVEKMVMERIAAGGGKLPTPYAQTFRTWGEAIFDPEARLLGASDLGFDELDRIMRPLGDQGDGHPPAWLDLLATKRLPTYYSNDYSAFDVPPVWGLNYASGGYVSGPGGPTSDKIPAMLSDGEFVMSAAATRAFGVDRLQRMNAIRKYAPGGPVIKDPIPPPPTGSSDPQAYAELNPPPPPPPPSGSSDPQAFADLNKPPPPPSGSSDPDAFADLENTIASGGLGAKILGGIGTAGPKMGGGGVGAKMPAPKDPRSRLAPAPAGSNHIHPALAGGIKGAFNAIGTIASTAAQAAMATGTMGGSAAMAAAGPAAGQLASTIIQAGTQMAGDLAVGGANVLSALLVGTVTPAETGQGYGAPLLPQQPAPPGGATFQSIHNGNIVTNNLSEYSRLKERKDAQKSAPFFNRV